MKANLVEYEIDDLSILVKQNGWQNIDKVNTTTYNISQIDKIRIILRLAKWAKEQFNYVQY